MSDAVERDRHGARWRARAVTPPILVIATKALFAGSVSSASRPTSSRLPSRSWRGRPSSSTSPGLVAAGRRLGRRHGCRGLSRQVARVGRRARGHRPARRLSRGARGRASRPRRRGRPQHAHLVRLRARPRRAMARPRLRARLGRWARPLRRGRAGRAARGRARLALPRGRVRRARGATVNPEVTFHDDDACLDRTYDLVLASSSLQYEPDWKALLRRLAAATSGLLLVTRLPVALEAPSFVILQRAQAYGYATDYLGWSSRASSSSPGVGRGPRARPGPASRRLALGGAHRTPHRAPRPPLPPRVG